MLRIASTYSALHAVSQRQQANDPSRPQKATEGEGANANTPRDVTQLSPEAKQELNRLKARDAEVKRHEQAHASVGGAHAGTPQYEWERGPDGRMYAVGGEVQIDVAPIEGDPEKTIQKMRQVRAAALAPAEPSSQDRQVAAKAQMEIQKARQAVGESRYGESLRVASPRPGSTLNVVACGHCGQSHPA